VTDRRAAGSADVPLQREAPVAAKGEGALLWDANDWRCLDAAGGAGCRRIGRRDHAIAAAIHDGVTSLVCLHAEAFGSNTLDSHARELAPPLIPVATT
jgi:adenosylmethionine-8-amino-7-oxononanoate aminotransferase